MTESQKAMLARLRTALFPILEANGFRQNFDPLWTKQGIFDFIRSRPNKNEFVAIQFHKYRDWFVIDISEAPPGATFELRGERIPVSRYAHTRERSRIQPKRGLF